MAEHRRLVLERVFQSFETLIFERGYDAVTLADIAKQAKMARTAIYNYFPDKETLLLAYTSHEMDDFFSDLRTRLYASDDPLDKLAAFVRAVMTYFATHHLPPGPALRSVISDSSYRSIQSHARTFEDILAAILDEAAAEGLLPAEVAKDPATIRLVLACLAPGNLHDLRPRQLQAAIARTQDFIRRAVGAAERTTARAEA